VDHLIPLDLGGADTDDNLWPEPSRSIEPVWNAERKDRLEWHMADLVCSGQLDLHVAQEAIRTNWDRGLPKVRWRGLRRPLSGLLPRNRPKAAYGHSREVL
jgi:hypothetical protein